MVVILIKIAADCEIRSVIHFYFIHSVKLAEITREIVSVYGLNVMTDGKLRA